MSESVVIVVGQGEIGKPLRNILGRTYRCIGIDIEPLEVVDPCSAMHICYPYQVPDFVATTAAYIGKYKPQLTIINSTVVPGTTRQVYDASGAKLAYRDRKSTRLNSSHQIISYAVFCLKKKNKTVVANSL